MSSTAAGTLPATRIKAVSCLLRAPDRIDLHLEDSIPVNLNPRAGDMLFARCLSDVGFITDMLADGDELVRLKPGDVVVAVLADRRTGYAVSARMPKGPVGKGTVLGLIYHSAIVAVPTCIPGYLGSEAMPLEVLGFVRGRNTAIANLADAAPIDVATWGTRIPQAGRMVVVCGTSSECGKTTFTTNFHRCVRRQFPHLRTAAIKACGTGANRDKQSMLEAGFDRVADFVDCGLATTYAVDLGRFNGALTALLNWAQAESDLVIIELGGDLVEGSAPAASRLLAGLDASFVLQVNDAMGALEGLRRFQAAGARAMAIGCFRQNLVSLADRLAAEGFGRLDVIDSCNETAMDALARAFVDREFGRDRIVRNEACAGDTAAE